MIRRWARALAAWLRVDRDSLPETDPRVLRVALVVTLVATFWFTAAAAWEIGGPFAAGHYGAATAVATGGENMWRWGVLGPVTRYVLGTPRNVDFYCHHPWGIFWTSALFVKVFGHHDWVCRLPAVLMSASMPPLLYAIGRSSWGAVAGAVTAAAFTVLPIALAFANFFALEVPVMFGLALAMWGYLRLAQTGRRRWLAVALGGLLYALHADWPGYIFGALFLPVLLARGLVLRRFFPPIAFRRFALFWALAACFALGSAALYVLLFARLGQLEEFLRQGEFRSVGSQLPIERVIEARRAWVDESFTPLAIALGKVAAPLLALRFVVRRRDGEFLPLAVLGTAIVQYVVFKQGADVHVFWPHYFALYFALAMGALTRTLESLVLRVLGWIRRSRWVPLGSLAALLAGVAVCALILPDGVRVLVYARKTGGRFNEKGSIIQPDIDKEAVLERLALRLPEAASVGLHSGMKQSYWMDWVLRRPVRTVKTGRSAGGTDRYYLVDSRFASPDDLDTVAKNHSVTALGPFWFVDRDAPPGALNAERIVRREPGALERYFVLGSHALRDFAPDPWARWHFAHHYGVKGIEPPSGTPQDFEQLRIAHNAALVAGDAARAAALRQKLLHGTNTKARCRYSDGSELLGVRFEPGPSDVLTVYFEAGEASESARYGIDSVVEEPAPWSLVPADPVVREVGMPFDIPTARWKRGFIYASVTEVLKRPGRERYLGSYRAGGPTPEGCPLEQTLLVLHD